MNSTQTLIVAKLHEMFASAIAETSRIVADPKFNPAEADQAITRQEVLAEVIDEIQGMETFRG